MVEILTISPVVCGLSRTRCYIDFAFCFLTPLEHYLFGLLPVVQRRVLAINCLESSNTWRPNTETLSSRSFFLELYRIPKPTTTSVTCMILNSTTESNSDYHDCRLFTVTLLTRSDTMASASTLHHHYVSHDQTDNSYEGLEVDDTQRGLHVIPVPCGLESTSAELPRDDYDRPQTAVGREGGEPFYSADKEILTTKAERLADNRTAAKSKRQRWFLVWVFVIVAVVIAIAVPLALYGKKTHDDR